MKTKRSKCILSLLLSIVLILGMLPTFALAADDTFSDVEEKDWFYHAVQYVYEKGIMVGTSADTFSPNTTTTRGMFVTILHRLEGTPYAAGEKFADVPSNQYYANAVAWASKNGIVFGYGNSTFGPNDTITREQMAVILYRYVLYKGYGKETTGDISAYTDADRVSSYAVEAMTWAVGSGMIIGVGSNQLAPRDGATRAQVAELMMRFCDSISPAYTRAEWVAALANKLGMNLEVDAEKIDYYYGDTKGHENAIAIEAARAYGILPPADVADLEQDIPLFYPDKTATREFAAYTAVKAMGFDGTNAFDTSAWADLSELLYPNEDAIAIGYGFLDLDNTKHFNPGEALKSTEVNSIFAAIDKINASTVVNPEDAHDNTQYQDAVLKEELSTITDYTVVDNSDATYTVTMPKTDASSALKAGDVIVLPANDAHVTGIAFKVNHVASDAADKLVLQCSIPATEEVFSSIDFAGVGTAIISGIKTPEGVSCEYDPNSMDVDENVQLFDMDLGGSTKVPGKLKFTLAEKTFSEGLKGSGTVEIEIPDVTCILNAHIGLLDTHVNEFTISIQEIIKFSAELKYTLAESGYELTNSSNNTRFEKGRVELGRLPIKIGATGLSFDIVFFYNVEAKGTASVTYTIDSTQGYQYKNGTSRTIFNYKDRLDLLELKGSAKAGLGLAGDLCAFELMDIIGYSAEAGVGFNISFTPHILATDTLFCGDATIYAYCTSGLDTETAIGKFLEKVCHYTLQFEHLKNDANNPYKLKFHIENAHIVNECTFGTGTIEGYVESLDTHTPIANARIRVYQGDVSDGKLIRTRYTDAEGKYSMDNLTAGTYIVQVSATGYYTFTIDDVAVTNTGASAFIETSLLVDRNPSSSGTVTGKITDAMTGDGISGTSYVIRKGWNKTSGDKLKEGTFQDSEYSLSLSAGNYTIEISKSGYVSNYVNIAISDTSSALANITLNPEGVVTPGGSIRIILTWGETPTDLDSHLFGPKADDASSTFHTYYSNKDYYHDGTRIANLDLDDTSSYGPETTTIYALESEGTYSFYVHDYTNLSSSSSTALSLSGAKVQVYSGSACVATFNIPTYKEGTVWHVFDYDAATDTIIPVNEFSYSSNTGTLK